MKKYNLERRIGITGYTLLEALFAIAIFSMGIIGIGGMLQYTAKGSLAARKATEAVFYLNNITETINALPFEAVEKGDIDDWGMACRSGNYTPNIVSARPRDIDADGKIDWIRLRIEVSYDVLGRKKRVSQTIIKTGNS